MKRVYKSGFTLLELLISISIIVIVLSLGVRGSNVTQKIINNIRFNTSISELSNLFSFAKLYCNKNNTSVRIYLKSNGGVLFKDMTNNYKKNFYLPDGVKFIANYTINCSNYGVLSSDTIYITNDFGDLYKITISVGIDNINIYYGD